MLTNMPAVRALCMPVGRLAVGTLVFASSHVRFLPVAWLKMPPLNNADIKAARWHSMLGFGRLRHAGGINAVLEAPHGGFTRNPKPNLFFRAPF